MKLFDGTNRKAKMVWVVATKQHQRKRNMKRVWNKFVSHINFWYGETRLGNLIMHVRFKPLAYVHFFLEGEGGMEYISIIREYLFQKKCHFIPWCPSIYIGCVKLKFSYSRPRPFLRIRSDWKPAKEITGRIKSIWYVNCILRQTRPGYKLLAIQAWLSLVWALSGFIPETSKREWLFFILVYTVSWEAKSFFYFKGCRRDLHGENLKHVKGPKK